MSLPAPAVPGLTKVRSYSTPALTPATAIERLASNDPTFVSCDLTKNIVMQMKTSELVPKLGAALAGNTVCQELNLSECAIPDNLVQPIADALAKNTALVQLNMQGNKIGNDGAVLLANSLAGNRTLMQINLMGQQGKKFGDAALHAFMKTFETNVTLLKIVWRLESRISFSLNKKLTRNNEIDRRIKTGRDYSDIMPEGGEPLSAALVEQRAAAACFVGTPRDRGESMPPRPESFSGGNAPFSGRAYATSVSSGSGAAKPFEVAMPAVTEAASRPAPAPAPAPAAPAPAPAPAAPEPAPVEAEVEPAAAPVDVAMEGPGLEAELAALAAEEQEAVAKLRAEFAARKAELQASAGQ